MSGMAQLEQTHNDDTENDSWLKEETERLLNWKSSTKVTTLTDFDVVMEALSRKGGATECEALLHVLEQRYDELYRDWKNQNPTTAVAKIWPCTPSVTSYTYVLHSFATMAAAKDSRTSLWAAQRAHAILQRMMKRYRRMVVLLPGDDDYDDDDDNEAAMDHDDDDDDDDVENEEMGGASHKLLPPFLPPSPSTISFHCVMNAWSKAGYAYMAEEVYREMEEWHLLLSRSGSPSLDCAPNEVSLATLLDAWANQSDAHGADRDYNNDDDDTLRPEERAWHIFHHALAKGAGAEKEQEASRLLPHVIGLNSLLRAWAKSGCGVHAAQRAQSIVTFVEQWIATHDDSDSKMDNLAPNTRTYCILLDAWANAAAPSLSSSKEENVRNAVAAAQQCEDLLSRMEQEASSRIAPSVVSFTTCIAAWANCADAAATKSKGTTKEVEQVSDEKEEENRLTAMMAANRAEALLERFVQWHSEEHQPWEPNGNSNNDGDDDAALSRLVPNTATANAVLRAHARCASAESGPRAEALLRRMMDPSALSSSMPLPNATSLNIVLDAYAKSDTSESVHRVLTLLKDCEESSSSSAASVSTTTTPRPDIITYNAVMDCLARRGEASLARQLLERLERRRNNDDGDTSVPVALADPDVVTYTSCLMAHARSQEPRLVLSQAHDVLRRMKERASAPQEESEPPLRPDVHLICVFLQVCVEAFSNDDNHPPPFRKQQRKALRWAIQAYEDFRREAAATATEHLVVNDPYSTNHSLYYNMMKVCCVLSTDGAERSRLLARVFDQCCTDGCLSRAVFGYFLRNSTLQLRRSVLGHSHRSPSGGDTSQQAPLPREWSLRVRRSDRPHWI